MAGEFGDLLNLDFSGGVDAIRNLSVEDPNVSVPTTTMFTEPYQDKGTFGNLFQDTGVKSDATTGAKSSSALAPFANLAKEVAPFVQLGTAGMGLAAGVQGAKTNAANVKTQREALNLQKQVAANQAAAAAPLTEFGKSELELAQAGNVPPAVQAEIDQLVAGYKQKINDFAARSGQGDSTMIREWLDWADKQGLALKSAYLQQQQQMGVSALGQGAQALGGAGQTAANIQTGATNQSAQIQALLEQSNKALAALTGGAA